MDDPFDAAFANASGVDPESLILGRCSCCGDVVTIAPDNDDPLCWECFLLGVRTPEEDAMTRRLSLDEWKAYLRERSAGVPS